MNGYVLNFTSEARRLMPVFGLLFIALTAFYWNGTAIEAQLAQAEKSFLNDDSIFRNKTFDGFVLAGNDFSNAGSFADFPPTFQTEGVVKKRFSTVNFESKNSLKTGKVNFGGNGSAMPVIDFNGFGKPDFFSRDARFRTSNLTE